MDQVTAKNIKTAVELDCEHGKKVTKAEAFAIAINNWSGSIYFLLVHFCFFGSWIVGNLFLKVDPYPFIFLTMLVSLESIFLSGLLLMAQNRISAQQDRRHQLDLQINLLAEQENTVLLRVIDRMAKKMGVDSSELSPYLDDTQPGEVMQALENEEKKADQK